MKRTRLLLSAALLWAGLIGHAAGQDLRLTVDRESGVISLENAGAEASAMQGYSIGSAGSYLIPDAWTSLTDGGTVGWVEANPSANWLSELNRNMTFSLEPGASQALGVAYTTGGHQPDIVFEYITPDREVLSPAVHYTGPANNLAVYLDPATGEAAMANLSPFIDPPEIKGYSILSESGALNTGGWSSMAASGAEGWVEANPAAEHLSELNRSGAMLFGNGTTVPMGQILAPGSETRDLIFEYFTTAGEVLMGSVEYIPLPGGGDGLPGDFDNDSVVGLSDIDLLIGAIASGANAAEFDLNSDGAVNLIDRDIFLGDGLISDGNKLTGDADFNGIVDFTDFLTISGNFNSPEAKWSLGDFDGAGGVGFSDFLELSGNFNQTPAAASVPEPTTAHLLLFASVVLGFTRRR